MKIQIAFSKEANLEVVREGLQRVKREYPEAELYSLFLPRKIVVQKGWSTDIVDLIDEELPNHIYILDKYDDMDACMINIDNERILLANTTDKLAVLDSGVAIGVQKEIMAHSDKILMW